MPLIVPEPTSLDDSRRFGIYIPLLAYVAVVFLLVLVGYQAFRQLEGMIQQEKLDDLNTIAAMKIDQIVSWREAQQRNGEVISKATLLPSEFVQWLHEGAPTGQRQQKIAQMLVNWRQAHSYRDIALVDRQGAVKVAPGIGAPLDTDDVVLALQAMAEGKALLSDIHRDAGDGEARFDLAAPLIVHDGNRRRVVGAAVLHIDPADFFFPLIQAWPVQTASAETLLVRQEGEELLFLNKLRHLDNKPMTLRLPVNTPNLPPGMFLRGKLDPLNSMDYRRVAVIASVSRVPGTNWLMVSKIDKAELFASLFRLKQWSALALLVFLSICGVLFFVWLRVAHERYRHLQALHDAAVQSGLLLKHFEYLTRYANDIILVADDNGKIIEANERAESAYGYTRDELLDMQIWDLCPSADDLSVFHEQIARFRESGGITFETTNRRKDGSIFPVEVSARVIELLGVNYLQGIIRDIGERKASERRILRLNDLYAAISQTNSAIMRIKDRAALYQEICRIAVTYGHFRLAWIGMADADNRYILPVASSGPCAGYLDDLVVPITPDETGRGPTALALHHGEAVICNDFQSDPRTAPWHDNGRKYGLRSSASWPFGPAGKTLGVLTLYGDEVDYFDDEMVALLTSISRDISFALDSLAMEESLRHSEEKFRSLVENLPQNIFIKDPDSVYISCNMVFANVVGVAPEQIAGMTDYDFFPPEMAGKYRADDRRIIDSGEVEEIEEAYVVRGQARIAHTIKVPFKNPQGVVTGVLGMFHDVTERRQAELLAQRFGYLLRASFNEIYLFDASSLLFLETSEGARKNLGYSAEAMARMTPLDIKPSFTPERFEQLLAPLRSGEQDLLLFETLHRRKDGTTYPVEARLQFMNAVPPAFLAVIQDVTERKLAESELLRQRSFFRQVIDADPNLIFVKDAAGRLLLANQALAKLYGMQPDDMLGEKYLAKLKQSGNEAERYLEMDREVIRTRQPVSFMHPTSLGGKERWFMNTKTPLELPDGSVNVLGISMDITERRRAEEELRESEALFRAMADNAPIIIWMADARDGHNYSGCGSFNQGWHDFTGQTLAQTQGQGWLQLVHPDDRELCLHVYQEGFRLAQSFKHEFRLMRYDGMYRWLLDSGVPRFAGNGEFLGFIGTCIDVTEQKNSAALRSEVERVGRLNVAMEMASGLAHELSQPLAAANNYLAGCLFRMKGADWDQETLRKALELTLKQTGRAGNIINHLKSLIRKQVDERLPADINVLVQNTLDFLEHETRQRGIQLSMVLPPLPLPPALVNKVEIEQVLINLLKNAIDAMAGVSAPELHIVSALNDLGQIQVSVGDNGRGLSSTQLATLFDPFHTSKKDGLGLGLAICRSLVENHGGRIWADPHREFGAEFHFTLPIGENHE